MGVFFPPFRLKSVFSATFQTAASDYVERLNWTVLFLPAEFSLSAYRRNKRKMELAENMEAEHIQTKKRRQSSETVSAV